MTFTGFIRLNSHVRFKQGYKKKPNIQTTGKMATGRRKEWNHMTIMGWGTDWNGRRDELPRAKRCRGILEKLGVIS